MIAFQVEGMTCGHCTRAIERAIGALDPRASVKVDLGAQRVSVGNTALTPQAIASAIGEAGYRAVRLEAALAGQSGAAARSCCGKSRCC